jgi:hypothetical protein
VGISVYCVNIYPTVEFECGSDVHITVGSDLVVSFAFLQLALSSFDCLEVSS